MPVKDESKFLHVRLKPKAADGLRKLRKETRRSLNEEANIAVELYIQHYAKRSISNYRS